MKETAPQKTDREGEGGRFVGNSFLLFEPVFRLSASSLPRLLFHVYGCERVCAREQTPFPLLPPSLFLSSREEAAPFESNLIIDPEKVRRDLFTIYRTSLRLRRRLTRRGKGTGVNEREKYRRRYIPRGVFLLVNSIIAPLHRRFQLFYRPVGRPMYPPRIFPGASLRVLRSRILRIRRFDSRFRSSPLVLSFPV